MKGSIKSVAVERLQTPLSHEPPTHSNLRLHVTRGPPRQKIKRLMIKKDQYEGPIDVKADIVMCKHVRGKPKLRLIIDGNSYTAVEQCYIAGIHPSSFRRLTFASFASDDDASMQHDHDHSISMHDHHSAQQHLEHHQSTMQPEQHQQQEERGSTLPSSDTHSHITEI